MVWAGRRIVSTEGATAKLRGLLIVGVRVVTGKLPFPALPSYLRPLARERNGVGLRLRLSITAIGGLTRCVDENAFKEVVV